MNIDEQNREIGTLLTVFNYDLKARENPVIQISVLKTFCYFIVGTAGFLLFTGLLRACSNAVH
jgi:hypothetical protein